MTSQLVRHFDRSILTVGTSKSDFVTTNYASVSACITAALDYVDALGGGRIIVRRGTYLLTTIPKFGSNTTLEGEGPGVTILQKAASQNTSVFNNKDTTNGNSFVRIRGLTIDQNGANQSGGGGISFTGISDSIFEDVVFEQSRVFNLFCGSLVGTNLTGTLTFTLDDTTVTGSSTLFISELAVGDVIKSAGGHLQRVSAITSDTSLELDRDWGWATESAVAAKKVSPNARNRIINCTFKGTVGVSDNVGLGLFDDSLIQGCISRNSTGYGFGPDHANRLKLIGNTMYDNTNAGIGMETCGYCVVDGNISYGNGAGVYILSGGYRNIISNNQCRRNANGINISYNTTSFPKPDENTIVGNICEFNSTHGIRIGGAARTIVNNNRSANNDQNGIVTTTENSVVPTDTSIVGNQCYDNQDTKTQDRGIYILNGTRTIVSNNISRDSDHNTAGITDSGTTTTLANNITA